MTISEAELLENFQLSRSRSTCKKSTSEDPEENDDGNFVALVGHELHAEHLAEKHVLVVVIFLFLGLLLMHMHGSICSVMDINISSTQVL